ncbi:MAG TPA: phosphonate C-P lyase system protein PhnH [Eoetvoesiella sp.]
MFESLLEPAFLEPVRATQETFRVVLDALSEPGLIRMVPEAPALDVLDPATYALCLTLLDSDTPVWLAPAFDTSVTRENLAFHCACPVVARREEAKFALLDGGQLQDLSMFDTGTDRDPDQSCTLLIQLPGFEQGSLVTLAGPGIERERSLRLPVDIGFWEQRKQCIAFPKGLDVFFTSGHSLIGLPRSTRAMFAIKGVL